MSGFFGRETCQAVGFFDPTIRVNSITPFENLANRFFEQLAALSDKISKSVAERFVHIGH